MLFKLSEVWVFLVPLKIEILVDNNICNLYFRNLVLLAEECKNAKLIKYGSSSPHKGVSVMIRLKEF